MIEAGTYRAKAKTWDVGKAGTGTPQVGVEFELLDYPGTTITYYGPLSPAALQYTIEALRNCGWTGDDVSDLSGMDANEVQIVVQHEEYPPHSGQMRARVRFVNRAGGIAMKDVLAGEELKSFAAALRNQIRALDAAAGRGARRPTAARQAPPPARQEPPPPTDDDIPF